MNVGSGLIYDLKAIKEIHAQIEAIQRNDAPGIVFLTKSPSQTPNRVGVLAGSFNPLTLAHTELVELARKAFGFDRVVLSISLLTTGKEIPTGASLEDRLLSLKLCAHEFNYAVAIAAHGLFSEQAATLSEFYGQSTKIFFIIGYDKLVQIFDAKYYKNISASLDQLFSLARLIVANRDDGSPAEIRAFLRKPENDRYAGLIDLIWLPPPFPSISSTETRRRVEEGEAIDGLVPRQILEWIQQTGAYQPRNDPGKIKRYEIRLKAVELFLKSERSELTLPHLKSLIRMSLESSPLGQKLREALTNEDFAEVLRTVEVSRQRR
jgi:nicotinate (nicotinamide) nucleotide adenylyltransferase